MQSSTLLIFAVAFFGAATTALSNPSPQENGVSRANNPLMEAKRASYGMCNGEPCSARKPCDEGIGCVCQNSQCVSGDNPQPPPNQPLPPVPQTQSKSGTSVKTASSPAKTASSSAKNNQSNAKSKPASAKTSKQITSKTGAKKSS
ncbi:unnamed protein product [Discula destructiva]